MKLRARVRLKNEEVPLFLDELANYHIVDFSEYPFSLEDYFMRFYKEDKIFEGVKEFMSGGLYYKLQTDN
jgi:ABC-2 type transport system ATP-binding protein